MSDRLLSAPDLTVSCMSLAVENSTPPARRELPVYAAELRGAPDDVRRVLADLSRLLLAEPAYRVEPVLAAGEPMAALRVEHRAGNPVVIGIAWP